jgi:hypothetical protein
VIASCAEITPLPRLQGCKAALNQRLEASADRLPGFAATAANLR